MQIRLILIEALPQIIAESVKPIENIDGIKIIRVDGLAGGGASGSTGVDEQGRSGASLPDQVVNSALRYKSQAPMVDAIMKEVGFTSGDLNGLAQAISADMDDVSGTNTDAVKINGSGHINNPDD